MLRLSLKPQLQIPRFRPNVIAIINFVALLALTCYFSIAQYRATADREFLMAQALVNEARTDIQEAISYSISATELLSFFVQEDDDALTEFDSMAKRILKVQKHIDALQLLPDGVICCVYPLEGNQSVVGYNILEDPNHRKDALQAIGRKQLFFSGPLTL
ncbi:MAG: hypothetical protein KF717_01455 [Cyclobacteriaceae bacterium]|nr:hypothetical protein [Cyclobacteriaceae bacterium]MCB0498498.1 hypothetical protein [Cyclobacteriaceae bacterium]MCB9236935.1 hypothetical protein [Flammeovirgaceae bacterium]MCW5901358.1 hypothetical protein [Cyclobacteriaceae bacterium]HPI80462.1 hypothetical protein [Cyclobacteriaceae bacterium]